MRNRLLRKNRLGALAVAVALGLCAPASTQAMSIGELTIESTLNAPLEGLLLIQLDPGEVIHEGELDIKLASSTDHRAVGIPYPMVLREIEFIETQQLGQTIQFRLFSPQPVSEPIISLLLELEWDKGKLRKEVTLLLDPVDYSAMRGISPENENLLKPGDYIGSAPQPAPTQQEPRISQPIFVTTTPPQSDTISEDSEQASSAPRQKITITNGEYGPVRAGDTLSRIAVVAARNVGIDVGTMMELIYDANPEAFGGSPDLLVRGSNLQIPGMQPNLRDVQTIPSSDAQVISPVEEPPPPPRKPLLTIVGSEDEAARIMPMDDKSPSGSLTQAGRGESSSSLTPDEGNSKLETALVKIQELELQNQTLENDKLALENNLASTREQLGSVRNELDRLVVELKALSQLQTQQSQQSPTLSDQIERWLPWLLLFLTLPVALFLGLRSRQREPSAPVYVRETQPQPSVENETSIEFEDASSEPPSRHNPAASESFSMDEAEEYLPEYSDSEADETLANEELLVAQEQTDETYVDTSSGEVEAIDDAIDDPLAETLPGISPSKDLSHWEKSAPLDLEEDEDDSSDEDEWDQPERQLQSLPSEGDTQEVIRSTLHKLEATQLISPGEAPNEPETALDAVQEAEIYIAYDQFSLAEKTIDKLLAEAPDNDRYLLLQLKLFAETGDMDRLQDLSVRLLHKHPDPDSEVNQRIRSICDKAFTQTNLKRADFSRHMEGKLAAENSDNETILEDMTAETLFVDGVEDYLDDATLLEEDEVQAGMSLEDTLSSFDDKVDDTSIGYDGQQLGSLTTELPPHVLEERDRTEIFDDQKQSLLGDEDDREETLSEGLELPFDLESEIARYESELESDLEKKRQS